MEPDKTNPTSADLLEERLEIQEKLTNIHFECDGLRQRFEETMELLRGLKITLQSTEKKQGTLEARVEEINRTLKSSPDAQDSVA